MNLSHFLKTLFSLTFLALIYIHLQMQIFDLAYKAKEKERFIHKLVEEKGNLTYKILVLTSSNHLGEELLGEKSDMDFVGIQQVTPLATEADLLEETIVKSAASNGKSSVSAVLSLLTKTAEAK